MGIFMVIIMENRQNSPRRPEPYREPVRPPRPPQGMRSPQARRPRPAQEPPRRPGPRTNLPDTRPLEPYPGYTPMGGRPQQPRAKQAKKSKALPLALSCLVLVGILLAVYFLFIRQQGPSEADLTWRAKTNDYRQVSAQAVQTLVKNHRALDQFSDRFQSKDQLKLLADPPQGKNFVDTDQDYAYVEGYHPSTMGRLVIPSIGTNGPLCADATEQTLYYGFGLVPFMPDLGEEGMAAILGHRCLTKEAGVRYLEDIKESDPYYIDDYRSGTRYYYSTKLTENVTEEDYIQYAFDPNGRFPGQSTMLVTCDPFIYDASERRILVYGEMIHTGEIPADDPFYQRYKADNGL